MLTGVVVVVIVWYFDLQLHEQLVPITTNVVSWNPAQARRYSKQQYVIKFGSGFHRVLRFPPPIKPVAVIAIIECL